MKLKGFKCELDANIYNQHYEDNLELLNDLDNLKGSQLGRMPITKCKVTDANNLIMNIVCHSKFAGRVSLEDINFINRSAELKVFLLETYKGQGIAFEACQMIIYHGFRALNLHRIYAGTLKTNGGFKSLAMKLGFRKEGTRIQAAWKNGEYVDVIEYGLLRSDFIGV